MESGSPKKNMEKGKSYTLAFDRIALAIENGFPLEAITMEESIISDRLRAYCEANGMEWKKKHAGLGEVIEKVQADPKNNNPELQSLCMEIDAWRQQSTNFLHGIVKTRHAGDEPDVLSDDFVEQAMIYAEKGKGYARKICDLSKKMRREREKHSVPPASQAQV